MAVPAFGFSFGDSVNAIQLTARVTHALRASSTAPTECRNAVTFLETVEHTFRRVYDLQHLREDTEAFQQVQVCTQACCEQLVHILERIRRYDAVFATAPEVGAGGLRIRLRKNTAKVKWSLAIKEDLAGIIAAITPQISLLLQLANTDNVASMRQQQERIAETAQHNQLRLARVLRHLELDTCAGAEREDNTVTSAVPVVSLPRKRRAAGQIQPETVDATPPGIDTLTGDAERLLTLLAFCVWRLMSRFMLAMASLPQAPTTFLGSNITLTDGLGRTLRLPYEHFSDWSMILTRLTVAFRGCPGETKVARGNFVIYGTRDKSRRLHDFNWERNVRPGAKVFMVFVIKGQGFPLGHCPRCGCGNNIANHFGWVTCPECDLRHQLTSEERIYPLWDIPEPYRDVSRSVWAAQLDQQVQQEQRDLQAYKCIQWTTIPCMHCHKVFTSLQAKIQHIGDCRSAEFFPADEDVLLSTGSS